MKKLVQIIDKRMMNFSLEIKKVKEDIKNVQRSSGAFELIKIDPDNCNYDVVLEAVGEEYKDDIEYITKFQGWMEDYAEEEQVKIAYEKLYNILSVIEKKYDKSLDKLKEKLDSIEKLNKEYKVLREKLSCYSKKVYIEENEFNIICDMINEIDEEEAIKILRLIGKHNAFIELEKRGQLELIESLNGEINLETLEEMNKNRISKNEIIDQYSYDYVLNKIEKSLKTIETFTLDELLVQYIYSSFDRFKTCKDKITKEKIEEADIFKDDLSSIDNYLMYSLAIILLLIEAIDNCDENRIREIYEEQLSSMFFEDITIEEQKLIEAYKKSLIDIFNEYYDCSSYVNFSHSYSSYNENELINYVDAEQIQSMKIMKLIDINKDKLDKMSIDELTNLLTELNKEITVYKEMLSKDELQDEETELNGLDIHDVSNFIVIRDTNKIFNDIDMITSEHPEVIPSLFTRALNRLYMMSSNDLFLRNSCKPILHDSNVYDIREDRAGSIRILFRTFFTKEGRVFYEVLSFAYGSCGDNKKTENLIQSVKEYSEHFNEYSEIEKNFKESNIEVMSRYLNDGLDLYNELLSKENEKIRGLV